LETYIRFISDTVSNLTLEAEETIRNATDSEVGGVAGFILKNCCTCGFKSYTIITTIDKIPVIFKMKIGTKY
jgi:hypothetical protein